MAGVLDLDPQIPGCRGCGVATSAQGSAYWLQIFQGCGVVTVTWPGSRHDGVKRPGSGSWLWFGRFTDGMSERRVLVPLGRTGTPVSSMCWVVYDFHAPGNHGNVLSTCCSSSQDLEHVILLANRTDEAL